MASSSYLEAYFIFMTLTKFVCETTGNHLTVEVIQNNYIELFLVDNNLDEIMGINLTVKDAERLMDELHIAIIKAEGGNNVIH